MKTYSAIIEEDENGDAVLPLPPEMLLELGWKEGDTLDWKNNGDGTYSLVKLKPKDD